MNGFERLSGAAGEWAGSCRVRPFADGPADEAPSRLTVTPVLFGTFLRFDQEWSREGEPQSGSLLVGYLPRIEQATIHWIDTWHNGRRAMSLTGRFDALGRLVAHGGFPVDGGPDWGWRIEIAVDARGELTLDMACVNPATGGEEGWVRARFARRDT